MRRFASFTTILLTLLAAPSTHAAGIEAKERAARKACLSGDYAKGVAILSDLFIDTKDPNFIFNQARCFEQNNRCEEAVSRFREFLRKAGAISPEDKADTEKHIADCQALLGQKAVPEKTASESKTEAAPAVTAATIPAPNPPAVAMLPPTPAPEQIAVAAQPAATAPTGRGLRIAGITCGAVGVASVGTAIYFYTRARSFSDKVAHEVPRLSSDEQAGKNAETMQWVFYGVGAAAIATGTVLYVLGWPSGEASHAAAGFAPMLGPGMAGISAQGAF